MFNAESDIDDSAIIGIIVGSTVGGLFFFICCPTVIITIVVCAVYHTSRSGRTVIATHPTATTSSGDGTASGATDQPGFQLQNLGNFLYCALSLMNHNYYYNDMKIIIMISSFQQIIMHSTVSITSLYKPYAFKICGALFWRVNVEVATLYL